MIPDHRKRKTRINTPPHPHRVTIGEFGVYDESWVPFFHLSDDASSCEPCLDVWKRASLAADSLGRDRVLLLLHSLGHILDFKTISPKEAEKARLERERKLAAQYSKHPVSGTVWTEESIAQMEDEARYGRSWQQDWDDRP